MPTIAKTLPQALATIRTQPTCSLARACQLDGLPVGGWGETAQARSRLVEALPWRTDRDYTADDLIAALYAIDSADRYQRRSLPAPIATGGEPDRPSPTSTTSSNGPSTGRCAVIPEHLRRVVRETKTPKGRVVWVNRGRGPAHFPRFRVREPDSGRLLAEGESLRNCLAEADLACI
jgi:hypothetical protein